MSLLYYMYETSNVPTLVITSTGTFVAKIVWNHVIRPSGYFLYDRLFVQRTNENITFTAEQRRRFDIVEEITVDELSNDRVVTRYILTDRYAGQSFDSGSSVEMS